MCAKALSCPTNIPPLILTICLEVLHLVEELLVIDVHSERTELLESLAMILHHEHTNNTKWTQSNLKIKKEHIKLRRKSGRGYEEELQRKEWWGI